jgi:CRISPR type III-A-associated RAMP protein Csm4
MNPGLVVKLRPSGPWRIGPDSGARNRVDVIFHSDSLYSAVTAAMERLGSLDEWLDATARSEKPAVCFSSCFPFLDEIGFIVPPRTMWPPSSPALLSARVRWKSARFVPLGVVQALAAGQTLDESHWSIDGPSECLVPAGRPGPFRTGMRWSAAVDRLTGAAERHSTACIEFRPGAGLWTTVSFADEAARDRWLDPIKTVFRLLADTGLGGERSRGWGRSEQPEFIEGTLPEMILGPVERPEKGAGGLEKGVGGWELGVGETQPADVAELAPPIPSEPPGENAPETAATQAGEGAAEIEQPSPDQPIGSEPTQEPESPTPNPQPLTPIEDPQPLTSFSDDRESPTPNPQPPTPIRNHWLLSLFTPGPADAVDWGRGNYAVLVRGGRVESPAGSGEIKKQVHMIAEGSVVYADSEPRGSASDVAPDGFPHPVFRAGFAVSIPLPEVS